jgi:hypothetical protein
LIHASVGHPQTNGKLERAFRDDMRTFISTMMPGYWSPYAGTCQRMSSIAMRCGATGRCGDNRPSHASASNTVWLYPGSSRVWRAMPAMRWVGRCCLPADASGSLIAMPTLTSR